MISTVIQTVRGFFIISAFLLGTACASVQSVGEIGPKKLHIYAVTHNDFLSADRMLIVLNEKGDVAAYTGGTVSGGGTVAVQTAGTIATAGAVYYGAQSIQHGLQNAKLSVKGVPQNINVNTTSTFHVE